MSKLRQSSTTTTTTTTAGTTSTPRSSHHPCWDYSAFTANALSIAAGATQYARTQELEALLRVKSAELLAAQAETFNSSLRGLTASKYWRRRYEEEKEEKEELQEKMKSKDEQYREMYLEDINLHVHNDALKRTIEDFRADLADADAELDKNAKKYKFKLEVQQGQLQRAEESNQELIRKGKRDMMRQKAEHSRLQGQILNLEHQNATLVQEKEASVKQGEEKDEVIRKLTSENQTMLEIMKERVRNIIPPSSSKHTHTPQAVTKKKAQRVSKRVAARKLRRSARLST